MYIYIYSVFQLQTQRSPSHTLLAVKHISISLPIRPTFYIHTKYFELFSQDNKCLLIYLVQDNNWALKTQLAVHIDLRIQLSE